jgi:membrane protease subunit HflK
MPWNSSGPSGGPWGPSGGGSDRPGGNGGGDGQRPPGGGGPWGSGGGGGPFGGRPGGGRPGGGGPGGQLPDFDELIKDLQATVRRFLGGGGGGRVFGWRGIALFGIAVVAVWLASGFYRVQPDEQGVVLRFGAFDRTTLPGLNYHLPWPIEEVERPAVTRINRIEIGYRTSAPNVRIEAGRVQGREIQEESLMLTGDENIIDIDCAVFWRISDAKAYLFNTRNPDVITRAVAESSLREVIGRTPIQPALTELRAQIEHDVLRQTQQILNNYGAGVEITQVQLQKVDPPGAVIESFRDVQRANTDAERMRNEAESYRNDIVPRARGDAARITAEAQGYKQATVAGATGQTQRFLSVLAAYQQAKDVTMQRMYLETMQDILSRTPAVVVDDRLKGLVPFLPLNLPANAVPAPQPSAPTTAQSAQQPAGATR